MTTPSSTAQFSKLTAKDNADIESQVAAETAGLSIADVEAKVSTAYIQYKAASNNDDKDCRDATVALFRWALLGRHLDSMQSDSQHVSSIALVAGFWILPKLTTSAEQHRQ